MNNVVLIALLLKESTLASDSYALIATLKRQPKLFSSITLLICSCFPQVVDCGRLPPPTNGDIMLGETTFGSEALYSCEEGFELTGSRIRTCMADGQWSASEPTCEPASKYLIQNTLF